MLVNRLWNILLLQRIQSPQLHTEKLGDSLKPSSLKEARSQVRRRDRVINHPPNFSPHSPRFKTWVEIIVVLTSLI